MKLFEKINQNREDKILRQIRSRNINEKDLIKTFKNSSNKIHFVSQCNLAFQFQLPQSFIDTILEFAKKDTNFLIAICPILSKNKALQNIVMSELDKKDIINNPEVFRILDDDIKLELLQNVETSTIPQETLLEMSELQRYSFVSSLEASNISKTILDTISEQQRMELSKKMLLDDEVSTEKLNELFGKEQLEEIIKQIVEKRPESLNDRMLSCVSEERKTEITILAKLAYSIQRESKQEVQSKVKELYQNDEYFKKYLLFRYENNVNSINDNETNPERSIIPLSDIILEYTTNIDLIRNIFDSQKFQNKKVQLLLKYYIQDRENTTTTITSIEELMSYPKVVLERQEKIIKSGNREDIIDIIIQNLTGLSAGEYADYKNKFLENHDIEEVLENDSQYKGKLKNLVTIKELLSLVQGMDEKQLQEFATNISLRNYNELMQGDFSLVSKRESFRDLLSSIEQVYGKEINQSLGYSVKSTDTVQFGEQKVNIHDLNGQFTLLIHMTEREHPNHHDNRTCMSLISEGHYDVAMESQGCKQNPNACFFIFDNVPPELLYASANHNMSSNSLGRTNSNFMTTNNTILNARPEISTLSQESFTEQTYYYQGFDREGKFVRIKPKALATFQEMPNEHTLELAARYGLDILRIPDMQTNLQQMLDDGIVTPSLIKGFQGDCRQILEVFSKKDTLTKTDVLSLQTLMRREESPEIRHQIDELLKRIPQMKGKDEILSLVNNVTLSEFEEISAETRTIYELIKNQEFTQEKE